MTRNPSQTNAPPAHEAWPAERFYWSIVEAPGTGQSVPPSDTLLLLMEDDLPTPTPTPTPAPTPIENLNDPTGIDGLHAVGVRLDKNLVLACAAPKEELAKVDPTVVTLTPKSIPHEVWGVLAVAGASEALNRDAIDPASLNLLVGAFEPAPIRRERERRWTWALATLLALSVVLGVGLWRRTSAWTADARDAESARAQLLSQLAPDADGTTPDAGRESLLREELTRLRRTRWSDAARRREDATAALFGYLSLWPKDARVQTDYLTVTPQSIALSFRTMTPEDDPGVVVTGDAGAPDDPGDPGDPGALIARLPRPQGWTMEEPRLAQRGERATLSIRLQRDRTPGGAP